jgi:hypothetical protein
MSKYDDYTTEEIEDLVHECERLADENSRLQDENLRLQEVNLEFERRLIKAVQTGVITVHGEPEGKGLIEAEARKE